MKCTWKQTIHRHLHPHMKIYLLKMRIAVRKLKKLYQRRFPKPWKVLKHRLLWNRLTHLLKQQLTKLLKLDIMR